MKIKIKLVDHGEGYWEALIFEGFYRGRGRTKKEATRRAVLAFERGQRFALIPQGDKNENNVG